MEGVKAQLRLFYSWYWMEVRGRLYVPAGLTLLETSFCFNCVGGRVEEKKPTLARIELRFSGRPARIWVALLAVPASTSSSQCLLFLMYLIPWYLRPLSLFILWLSFRMFMPFSDNNEDTPDTVHNGLVVRIAASCWDDPRSVCNSDCRKLLVIPLFIVRGWRRHI